MKIAYPKTYDEMSDKAKSLLASLLREAGGIEGVDLDDDDAVIDACSHNLGVHPREVEAAAGQTDVMLPGEDRASALADLRRSIGLPVIV